MTTEQRFFIQALADCYSGRKSAEPGPSFDWPAFWAVAEEQDLGALLYQQLKNCRIPSEIRERFRNSFISNVFFLENRRSLYEEIANAFASSRIEYFAFKGWIVKNYWQVPALRSMGDLDILIHAKDRQASDAIMLSLGFKRFVDNQAVWTYLDEKLIVEIHDHMFYEHLGNSIDYQSYFDRAWEHVDSELDPSFHFVYLVAHMAKHLTNKGIGFRFFLDLMFMCRAEAENLRWPWICEQLESLQLLAFAKTCFALGKRWFSFAPPIPVDELDDDFFAFVTEKIFQDGIFGLDNPQNTASASAKEIRRSKLPYWLSALLLTLRRLFPPYQDMQLIPWYSFVDGRPWLLPVAWVYRWFYCLRNKRDASRALLKEAMFERDIIDKRNQDLQKWGL